MSFHTEYESHIGAKMTYGMDRCLTLVREDEWQVERDGAEKKWNITVGKIHLLKEHIYISMHLSIYVCMYDIYI